MIALFDDERPGRAFAVSFRAFLLNVPASSSYAFLLFLLLLIGLAPSGVGLVLALPWIAAASYAAWKDIFGLAAGGR